VTFFDEVMVMTSQKWPYNFCSSISP